MNILSTILYLDSNPLLMRFPMRLLLLPALFMLFGHLVSGQEFGIASYYADKYQGRRTAYGVEYDKNEMTAAHKKHPFGTWLRVTRLDNGRSVVVKVIDKGPYTKGRIVDVSRAAARQLRLIRDGKAEVKVEVVSKPDEPTMANRQQRDSRERAEAEADIPEDRPEEYDVVTGGQSSQEETPARPQDREMEEESSRAADPEDAAATPREEEERQSRGGDADPTRKTVESATRTTSAPAPDRSELVGEDYQKFGLYRIRLERTDQSGYGVQVASLTNYQNVLKQVADLQARYFDEIRVSVEPGPSNNAPPVYKIILGKFAERQQADNYRKNLQQKYNIEGFVIDFSQKSYPSSGQ